jgi:hypothetical protein
MYIIGKKRRLFSRKEYQNIPPVQIANPIKNSRNSFVFLTIP